MYIHQSHRLKPCSKELKAAIESLAEVDSFKDVDISVRACTPTRAGFAFWDTTKNDLSMPKDFEMQALRDAFPNHTVTQEGHIFWVE